MRLVLRSSRGISKSLDTRKFAHLTERVLSANTSSRKTEEVRVSLLNGKTISMVRREVVSDVPAGRVGPAPANRQSGS